MNEELIYRRDCDLFAESLDYENMIHDTMIEYGFTWLNNKSEQYDPDHIFDFAYAILQKAQNIIDSADTIAYEKNFVSADGATTTYLTYEENDDEQEY